MFIGEQPNTRELKFTDRGFSGIQTFLCDWSDVDPALAPYLPNYGDPWQSYPDSNITIPYLLCYDLSAKEHGNGQAIVTALFSSDGDCGHDPETYFESSFNFGVENIDCLEGMRWQIAGTPVEEQVTLALPVINYSITVKRAYFDMASVASAVNCLNEGIFHGFPAETMRFDGADNNNSYDANGNVIGSSITYKFIVRASQIWDVVTGAYVPFSHNYEWRKRLQALGVMGNSINIPLIWYPQSYMGTANEPYPDTLTQRFYTTDQTKMFTPVWVNELDGYELNPAGMSSFDKPCAVYENATVYKHRLVDLGVLLNLPKITGDA